MEEKTQSHIIQWNMQSYRTKFSDLKIILNRYAPICVCLQETLLKPEEQYSPSGYNLIKSTPVQMGGHERGAAILIRKTVPYEQINLDTTLQAVAIKMFIGRTYTVCSLYLPHIEIQKQEMTGLMRQLRHPYLLLGDMNAKSPIWGETTTNNRGKIIEQILLEEPISLMNDNSPTHFHIQTGTYSTIDLSICSSESILDFDYRVLDSRHDSDHYPICINIKDAPQIGERPIRYKTEKADWKKFKETTKIAEEIENEDIDVMINILENEMMIAAKNSMPTNSGSISRPPLPWWNDDVKTAILRRLRAERRHKRNKTLVNKIKYNKAKAICRHIFIKARRESWQGFVSSINERTSSHKIWKKVEKINGKFNSHPSPILKDEDDIIQDPIHVANKLAESFARISSADNYTPKFKRYKQIAESKPIKFNSRNANQPYNDPISMFELKHALSLTSDSSPGKDNITYSMIKNCHEKLQMEILKIYNKIFSEQVFPAEWRTAIIIPILKPGKNPQETTSYRPISLTSCLSKLLEKILNIRLMWFLESNNLISEIQAGYRNNLSTTDLMTRLENDLQNEIYNRKHTIAVFFDIAKAYDTAWRYGVLSKLHEYGLRGNLPIFISNFLKNRKINVRIGNTLSNDYILEEGIPQGSVLSCTCFMIAMNGIANHVPRNVKSVLYVDDFTIYASGSDTEMIIRRLQKAINNLESWANETGAQFSVNKTKSIHVCRKRNCPKTNNFLTINGTNIECVDEYKFLGLTIDKSLTWRPHIQKLKTSCYKTLNLLKHLSHKDWGADRASLLRLYTMLIKPKIDYGCEAYSSACKSLLESIESIQNSALRIASGAFRSSPVKSLQAETGIRPLKHSRSIKITNYYARTSANPAHPMYKEILEQEDEDQELEIIKNRSPKSFLKRAKNNKEEIHLDINNIAPEIPMTSPPWRAMSCIHVCEDLFDVKKDNKNHNIMRGLFNEHFEKHSRSLFFFTDGSKTEQGVAYAYVNDSVTKTRTIQPFASIYTAELMAIYKSIVYSENHYPQSQEITIVSDSRSSLQAISKYNNKHPLVRTIQDAIASSEKRVNLCWVPSHVGIPLNEKADSLAREAINNVMRPIYIPRTDLKPIIKSSVKKLWLSEWCETQDNKLREIKDTVTPFGNSTCQNRRWEVTLCRLRIGHTHLTHGFLMEKGPRPFCEDCIVPLSVKHLLSECPNFTQERRACFGIRTSIKDILTGNNSNHLDKLHNYLISTNIFSKI